jgi:hypothetical protein
LKRYIRLAVLLAALSIPVVFASVLVLSPGLRYQIFRGISEAPGIVTFFSLRGKVIARDFDAAAGSLQRQLDWSLDYGVDTSVQVPSLIENTAFVMEAASLHGERSALAPYLRNLSASYPQLYRPQLWLGQALVDSEPKLAIESLERAAAIVPTDEQIYRTAILAANRLGNREMVGQWCNRYRTAAAGGSHPYQFNPVATGVGMRRVIAELPKDGEESDLIEYNALVPETENILEFPLPDAADRSEIMLHFGTAPSVVLDVREVILMANGIRTARISDGLVYQSRHGYLIGDNRVMLTGTYGDRLTISWPELGPVRADKVLVFVDVSRAPLTNLPGCSQ